VAAPSEQFGFPVAEVTSNQGVWTSGCYGVRDIQSLNELYCLERYPGGRLNLVNHRPLGKRV